MDGRNFYYRDAGQSIGPISAVQLKALTETGRLKPSDLVWREGTPDWVEANKIEGLFNSLVPVRPATNLTPTPTAKSAANLTSPEAEHGPRVSTRGYKVAALVAVLIALAAVWLWAFKPASERQSIERVLVQDRELGERIQKQIGLTDVFWNQSSFVGEIVLGLTQIDLAGCPEDFRQAYLQHIAAWQSYEQVARSYGGMRGAIKGFYTLGVAGIEGFMEGSAADDEIRTTFQNVLVIANKYGARPPKK